MLINCLKNHNNFVSTVYHMNEDSIIVFAIVFALCSLSAKVIHGISNVKYIKLLIRTACKKYLA